MTAERDVEEMVAAYERGELHRELWPALVADWRAKKAEIENMAGADCKYTGAATVLSVSAAELMAQKAAEAMRARCQLIAEEEAQERGHFAPDATAMSIARAIAALKEQQ